MQTEVLYTWIRKPLSRNSKRSTRSQKVIGSKDNDLAVKIIRLIDSGGFDPTTSQKCAREIMGKNFFGVEEAIRHFGVTPARQQTVALSETEETLTPAKTFTAE